MSDRTYISAHQPTIFIGGFWLDDAQSLEYQITDPKEPLYGFRDREFRTVATGQTLVHGMLDINFRYKGYLALVLQRLSKLQRYLAEQGGTADAALRNLAGTPGVSFGGPLSTRAVMHAFEGNDFQSQGIDPRRIQPDQLKDFLQKPYEDFDIKGFTRLSEAVKQNFWDPDGGAGAFDSSDQVAANRPRGGIYPFPFDMSIVYEQSDPSDRRRQLDTSRVEILRACHIVASSKAITNTVPGGGRAIVERYQFIAREVE